MNLEDPKRRQFFIRALFLAAAFMSFAFSVVLYFTDNENEGIFVGIWVPSILALGAFLAPRQEPAPVASGESEVSR